MVSDCLVPSIGEAPRVKDFSSRYSLHGRDENARVTAVKRSRTSAFNELWQSHSSRLYWTTFRVTRNREDAEDALQGALLNSFVHLQTFDGRSRFLKWPTPIAINSAPMIVRKNRSTLEVSLDGGFMRKCSERVDHRFGPLLNASHDRVRKRKAWVWMERSLLLCGAALLAVYFAARTEGILRSRAALKASETFDSTAIAAGPVVGESPASPEVNFTLWDGHRVQAYQQSLAEQAGTPLAVLRIPKIRLEVPVFDGTDDLTLNHAVGRIAGTARPGERGNIGIAGHRDGFFRGLKDIGIGDTIELKTPKGVDLYTVEQVNIVSPTDVASLRPRSVPSLTLVTCYPFYFIGSAPKRYIVTTSLVQRGEAKRGVLTPGLLSKTRNATRRTKWKP